VAIEITVRDSGPYLIRSEEITILDADGNALSWEGATLALCRCGGSSNKPFCDGTHREIGFESAPRAS
jgi:CDGSH-type Zn-finger protein